MKKYAFLVLIALIAILFGLPAMAQTYPVSTPYYKPTAVLPQTSLAAAGNVYFSLHSINILSVRLSGASAVTASIQVSNDPLSISNASATWTSVNSTLLPAGTPATAISAVGLYTISGLGFTRARLNVTAVTGTLLVNMAGS